MQRYRMLINGEWVEAAHSGYFPVYDPSTEEVMAEAPEGGAGGIRLRPLGFDHGAGSRPDSVPPGGARPQGERTVGGD